MYPGALVGNGIPRAAVTEALDAGARSAQAEHGLRIAWIFDFPGSRPTGGPGRSSRTPLRTRHGNWPALASAASRPDAGRMPP